VIPRKYGPALFALLLSGWMSLLVSGLSVARTAGLTPAFPRLWLAAWVTAWVVAFPIVLVSAPRVQRWVGRLLAPD
jgi:hypothetical protein